MKQKLLNDVQAAEFLSLAVQTLRNWRHHCKGPPYYKLSPGPHGPVRYKMDDLIEYREKHRIDPEK